MSKPIIYSLNAMSCEEDNEISFAYSGGLMKSNTIRLFSALTNELVYEHTETTARNRHVLLADSIDVSTYGTQFNIQIKVTEMDDTESSWSDSRYAIIISTPTFEFEDFEESIDLAQSFLNVSLGYSQAEGELLQSFDFLLYDSSHTLLSQSDTKYDTSDLSYTYNGLEDGIYYIQAKGSTFHGYQVQTEIIQVNVRYTTPELFASFFLTNDIQGGYVKYETNIYSIDYHGDETFDYDDGYIDLTEKTLFYDRGFLIENNATFIVKGKNLYEVKDNFFEVQNADRTFKMYISSYIYDDDTIRFKLHATNGLSDYILYSSSLSISNSDEVAFWIRKIDDIYSFKVYVNGEVVE